MRETHGGPLAWSCPTPRAAGATRRPWPNERGAGKTSYGSDSFQVPITAKGFAGEKSTTPESLHFGAAAFGVVVSTDRVVTPVLWVPPLGHALPFECRYKCPLGLGGLGVIVASKPDFRVAPS